MRNASRPPSMSRSGIRVASAFCGSALALACSSSPLPAPAPLPTYRIDLEASEVTVRAKSGDKVDQASAEPTRVLVQGIFNEMIKDRSDVAQAKPARFKADIVYDTSEGWRIIVPCVIFGMYFGCGVVRVTADVNLSFQVGDRTYVGVGSASVVQGLYDGSSASNEAVSKALVNAVASAGPPPANGAAPAPAATGEYR